MRPPRGNKSVNITKCFVGWLVWLVVFNVPSTAWSFRDGTPIYSPLRRTWSSINTPFRPGIEPRAVAWQPISLPLRYASSIKVLCKRLVNQSIGNHRISVRLLLYHTDLFTSLVIIASWPPDSNPNLMIIKGRANMLLVSLCERLRILYIKVYIYLLNRG